MIPEPTLTVTLVQLLARLLKKPNEPVALEPGRPNFYPERIFIQAAVIMQVKQCDTVHCFLDTLEQPTTEMQTLKQLLTYQDQFPSRRTWERRLAKTPPLLARVISQVGLRLLEAVQLWEQGPRAVAIDTTALWASGKVWHQRDRKVGRIPHRSIDTEAAWSKSGYHGWWYGWKLHLVCTAGDLRIPLAAMLTPANIGDNVGAEVLLRQLPRDTRYVLGDSHYHGKKVQALCQSRGWELVCSRGKRKPKPNDSGREVRQMLHRTRSIAIENFNAQYKDLFAGQGQVPSKGENKTRCFAFGAVLVYQLLLWQRHEQGLDLHKGFKAQLRAA